MDSGGRQQPLALALAAACLSKPFQPLTAGAMMRALSNALSLERSGPASPRVHPSEGADDAPAVAGAAAAVHRAASPTGLAAVEEHHAMEDEPLRQRHSMARQRQLSEQQPGEGQQALLQPQSFDSATDGMVAVAAAAGEAATAAAAAWGGRSQGGTSQDAESGQAAIPAVRRKGTRISFADAALVTSLGGASTPGAPLPRGRAGSMLMRSDGKPAALVPRPSILRQTLLGGSLGPRGGT